MNSPTYLLGVVQLPSVAKALTAAGYAVVTGDDYRAAATTIRAAIAEHGPFPVLVSDENWPGLRNWSAKLAVDTDVVMVHVAGGSQPEVPGAAKLATPTTLADLLAKVKRGVHPTFADLQVSETGLVRGFDPMEAPLMPAEPDPVLEPSLAEPQPEDSAGQWDEAVVVEPAAPAQDPWAEQETSDPAVVATASETAPPSSPLDDQWSEPGTPTAPEPEPESALDPWAEEVPAQVIETGETAQAPAEPTSPERVEWSETGDAEPEPNPVDVPESAQVIETSDPWATAAEPVDVPDADAWVAPETGHDAELTPPDRYIQSPSGGATPISSTGHVPMTEDPTQGQVVFVTAGGGGVGKSTTSIGLAQMASEAGLRVILIDADFGQGDLRSYLRIGMASLPSISNYASRGILSEALIDPEALTRARDIKQKPLKFGLVTTPPTHLTDVSNVTPEVYLRLVADARAIADLVIVDMAIMKTQGTTTLVDNFMIPLLDSPGVWWVGITDLSGSKITSLLQRQKMLASRNVPRDRMITFMNRVPADASYNSEGLIASMGEHSKFLGVAVADSGVMEIMNSGGGPSEIPNFAPFLSRILHEIVPDSVPLSEESTPEEGPRWRRWFGRRG